MSFGFSVSDFIAILELANRIRKAFVDAPEGFKAISDDVRGFSIVLQDVEFNSDRLSEKESKALSDVVLGCKSLLQELEKTLQKYCDISNTSSKTKIWKGLRQRLRWEPDDIRALRGRITAQISILNGFKDTVTGNNVVKLVRDLENKQREELLQWISPVNYVTKQLDLVSHRQPKSRRWLFKSPQYSQWLAENGRLLFCPGIPGAGKTFATAIVVERLQEQTGDDANTLTTFMYCSYLNLEETPTKLLCSLLRMSLQATSVPFDQVIELREQYRSSGRTLSRNEALELIRLLFSRFQRVNVLIDGVDELPSSVRRSFVADMLTLQRYYLFNLFVTSRDMPDIRKQFENQRALVLEIRSSDEDIRQFLRDHLCLLPAFVDRSTQLQDEIVASIAEASAGMLLLAELHLQSLVVKMSTKAVRVALAGLAQGSVAYDEAYAKAMKRIQSQTPEAVELAKQTLTILSCARVPLLTCDVAHALAIELNSYSFDADNIPDIEDVAAVCAGLVIVDQESNIVRLVHKSTQEYFERNMDSLLPGAQSWMASRCAKYLNIVADFGDMGPPPFYNYAKSNWGHHALACAAEMEVDGSLVGGASPGSPTMLLGSVAPQKFSIIQMVKEVAAIDSIAVDSCYGGHQSTVELLIVVNDYDVNRPTRTTDPKEFLRATLEGGERDNPARDDVLLTIAAARGDIGMIMMLLQRGADPNITGAGGQTALFIASNKGFENIVAILLDNENTNPNTKCINLSNTAGCEGFTQSYPLLVATEMGHLGCVKLLLSTATHDIADMSRNAIWYAAIRGHHSLIQEYLKCTNIDPNQAEQDTGNTPLAASIIHNPDYQDVYFDWDGVHTGVNPKDERYLNYEAYNSTPWMVAICQGDIETIQLLLPGSDVNREFPFRYTPLHKAVISRNSALVRLLLKQSGIDVTAKDHDGNTPFLQAVINGDVTTMEAFVDHGGIDFQEPNNNKESAYNFILQHGDKPRFINILLSLPNFDVNAKDSRGLTLLQSACSLFPRPENELSKALFQKETIKSGAIAHFDIEGFVATLLRNPNIDLREPLFSAALSSALTAHQKHTVMALLAHSSVNANSQNPIALLRIVCSSYFQGVRLQPRIALDPPDPLRQKEIYKELREYYRNLADQIFAIVLACESLSIVRTATSKSLVELVLHSGSGGMLKLLLNHPARLADAKVIFEDGRTWLSYAAGRRQSSQHTYNPSIVDIAPGNGHPNTLDDHSFLDVALGSCPFDFLDHADSNGKTPLIHATEARNDYATLEILKRGNPDVNLEDINGGRPLDYALYFATPEAECEPGVAFALLLRKPGIQVSFLDPNKCEELKRVTQNAENAHWGSENFYKENWEAIYNQLRCLHEGRGSSPAYGDEDGPLWTWVLFDVTSIVSLKVLHIILRRPNSMMVDWSRRFVDGAPVYCQVMTA
ncbi:ankyrin [Thozetella sp. PMI_491]|nr:ankyrin [Thozetella sp. PMI_491]